jgi:hypothetical protein
MEHVTHPVGIADVGDLHLRGPSAQVSDVGLIPNNSNDRATGIQQRLDNGRSDMTRGSQNGKHPTSP